MEQFVKIFGSTCTFYYSTLNIFQNTLSCVKHVGALQ